VEVRYHPLFERWLAELAEADEEILGEVMALLTALETHGRDLDDERREESHPVVTSRYDIHALRRTPPSEAAPYADRPPVLRILYAVCEPRTEARSPSSSSEATRRLWATTGIRRTSPRPKPVSTSTHASIPTPRPL